MSAREKPDPSAPTADAGPAPTVGSATRPRRRAWWLALALLGAVAFGGGTMFGWRWYRLPARVQASLPAGPKLAGKPALLVGRLARAQSLIATRGTALAGAAELGRLYHANGFQREAEACWRLLRVEEPREARWSYYLADLRRAASDYPEMTVLLEETVRLAPDYAPAWLQLANLKFKSGGIDAAEKDFQRRLALKPGDEYARLGLARIALQRGQRAEARRQIEALVHDCPNFSVGHNLYAEMLEADGDPVAAGHQRFFGRETTRYREADDPWLEDLNAWCYDFNRLCILGTIEYQTAHGDRGKHFIERAVQLAPENPAGYELLGSLLLKLGDHAAARDTIEHGLSLVKGRVPPPMLYVYLSQALLALHQPEDAVQAIDEGLARAGDAFELHDARGVALAGAQRQEEAVVAFRHALTRNPNDTNANYNLGMSLLALGRTDDAIAAVKRSLALKPTFPNALLFLGKVELATGQLDAAGRYLQPLHESHPEMREARELLALWHLQSGTAVETRRESAAAERHYRAGIVLDGSRPELRAALGALCLTQGRFEEARDAFEVFHRLRPADPQSSLFLGQTYAQLGRLAEARQLLREGAKLASAAGNTATANFCREILQSLPEEEGSRVTR